MDRTRFSTIAHRDHDFCSPVFAASFDRMVDLAGPGPRSRALDVGCGKGEALVRIAERIGAAGLGVDPNEAFVAEARRRAAARAPGRVEFRATTLADAALAPGSFDLAVCMGSTHAFGGYGEALRGLAALVRPGGHVLIGEGYWKRTPAPEYLALLGGTEDEFTDHAGNVAAARERGLEPVAAHESTLAEWDDYERRYATNVERHAAEHPDDPDREAMLARIRGWNDGYRRWGRDTLGFGLYLMRRP